MESSTTSAMRGMGSPCVGHNSPSSSLVEWTCNHKLKWSQDREVFPSWNYGDSGAKTLRCAERPANRLLLPEEGRGWVRQVLGIRLRRLCPVFPRWPCP